MAEKTVKRLKEKIQKLTETSAVEVTTDLHNDLSQIMEDNDADIARVFSSGSFQRLFWMHQLQALRAKDKRQVRWHPMMIRWCLHLKMLSSAAYRAMRSSHFMTLPSERTLRDYTHVVKSTMGIQPELNAQLIKEANVQSLEEWQKFVVVTFDEMKIKEDLVYDKNTCDIIGYIDLGEVNGQLSSLGRKLVHSVDFKPEEHVADHMLLFMVRGLFTDLEFPYAQYATQTASGTELFAVVWDVVRNLESCDLRVIALSCDGASPNRRFFRLHKRSSSKSNIPTYKTTNPYSSDERDIYFISDVPHLMKTARNCWSHSFAHGDQRPLWVSRPCMHC